MNKKSKNNAPKPMKYRLEKPLPGFPAGHEFKVDRSTNCISFDHNPTQSYMRFLREFLDLFPGWFTPIYPENKQTKL